MEKIEIIRKLVQSGCPGQTLYSVTNALKENNPPECILREGLVAGMLETEKKYRKNEILDSEVLLAAEAMKAGLEIIMPLIEAGITQPIGTIIIGTPEGDLMDTEKNIISCLLRSLGLKVIDLGTSVSCRRFIDAAIDEKAGIILCTAALTPFLPQMKALVQAARQANIRNKTKILLTGAPVTEWFCKSVDADMYAPDPIQAAETAAEYCRNAGNLGLKSEVPHYLASSSAER